MTDTTKSGNTKIFYAFIATHDNRLQCYFNFVYKQIHKTKEKFKMKRFKNCAIINIKYDNTNQNFNFKMIYEGALSDTDTKNETKFWKQEEFNNIFNNIFHKNETTNHHNIEIFLIRHGTGKHNINMTSRKKMGAKDFIKTLKKNKKQMKEYDKNHPLIDAELTDGDGKQNGITIAMDAGVELQEYITKNNIFLTNENFILGASKLRRTRQTIAYVMNNIIDKLNKKKTDKDIHIEKKMYIFPCVYEVAKVHASGECDVQSAFKTNLAFENKALCDGIVNKYSICHKIELNTYNKKNNRYELQLQENQKKQEFDINWRPVNKYQKFSFDIIWTYVNKFKQCDNLADTCVNIIKMIRQVHVQQQPTSIKQKYLKYKIKYLKLKQNLQYKIL